MERYRISWSIEGETEIEAENADAALVKFDAMHQGDIALDGVLQIHEGPDTEQDRERAALEWREAIATVRSKISDADIPF